MELRMRSQKNKNIIIIMVIIVIIVQSQKMQKREHLIKHILIKQKKQLKMSVNILKSKLILSLIFFTVLLSCESDTKRSFFKNIQEKVVFDDNNWYDIANNGEVWDSKVLYD